jgi:[ribosomal protein S18]-alanine N-acetyltransferase
MITEGKPMIKPTRDPEVFAACALMMTHSDPWVTLGMSYDHCVNAFGGGFREVYVMEVETELAGFAIMQTLGTFKGYIQTICINKPFRGKGFGKELIQFCEDRILGYSPNVFICVSAFNTKAIRLYEELGFSRVGEMDNFIKEGFTELLYRKTFGPIIGYTQQR